MSPGNYIEAFPNNYHELESKILDKSVRLLSRILEGDMVIFNKASPYNDDPTTYDGRHAEQGIKGFRRHIEESL